MTTNNSNRIKIIGSVANVRYYKNGWGIISCDVDEVIEGEVVYSLKDQIICKGTMPEVQVGEMYKICAEYVNDPKWGDQYNILTIVDAIDFGTDDPIGQRKFLAAVFTPLQVEEMYDALDNPFEALKNADAQALVKIRGCGFVTAEKWIRKFNNHYSEAKIYTELEEFNLTNAMIKKLMDCYSSPDVVVEKVKTNPYVLCNEVKGIGWKTADNIALNGGFETYSTLRIMAYIQYYLDYVANNGDSWITPDQLMGALLEELGEDVPDQPITDALHELIDNKILWHNQDKTKIGLQYYYNLEHKIAEELIRIRDAESHIKYTEEDFLRVKANIEQAQGWTFTDEQVAGAKMGLDNNVVVITGSGGTGKSSTVGLILRVLSEYKFAQCALSGRASSRLAEVTGEEGFTIHRLLGFPLGDKNGFKYHEENPLPQDVFIVDEISMIDSRLFYYLLRAIPSGAKLFLLGDPGQLESLGAGNVAQDCITSPEIPCVFLTQIHRQAAKSAIITESIKVRKGVQLIEKDWVGQETRGELQDLTLDCYSDKSNTFYKIMQKFSAAMNNSSFNILQEQVLVPIKTMGVSCTYEINNAIQGLYNPPDSNKREICQYLDHGKAYMLREGDKVINTANNYKTNPCIYNGNIGILKRFSTRENDEGDLEEVMIVDFLSIGEVAIPEDGWRAIELGYAITVHKSQGSEFDHVIFGLDFSSFSLLSKELVYTGITRAKKKCDLIAQSGALRMAISKAGVSAKQTHLVECLDEVAHPKLIF